MVKDRKIRADRTWTDFRASPRYRQLLDATAWTWIALLRAADEGQTHPAIGSEALREALDRATAALPQLPMEFDSGDFRFERSRWRSHLIEPERPMQMHCEHPWTKRKTREIVVELYRAGRSCRIAKLVEAVAIVLDARQDTVLLPSARLRDLGVIADPRKDGFWPRYRNALETSRLRLIDRLDGSTVEPANLEYLERGHDECIERARSVIGASGDSVTDLVGGIA